MPQTFACTTPYGKIQPRITTKSGHQIFRDRGAGKARSKDHHPFGLFNGMREESFGLRPKKVKSGKLAE